MKNTALFGILAVLVLEAGCMMGPKYKRPTVDVPQEYRAPAPQQASQARKPRRWAMKDGGRFTRIQFWHN